MRNHNIHRILLTTLTLVKYKHSAFIAAIYIATRRPRLMLICTPEIIAELTAISISC
jgi:hypothetical protein